MARIMPQSAEHLSPFVSRALTGLLATSVFLSLVAPAAGIAVYEPDRYYATTGPVRWMAIGDGALYSSDLRRQITALDLKRGVNRWSRFARAGRLDRVWKIGRRLVLVGVGLEVLDTRSGRVLWRKDLGCRTKAQCVRKVVAVDDASVYISQTGAVHRHLLRLSITDGAPMWRAPAQVAHPQRVIAGPDSVVSVDALPPFRIRLFSRSNGQPISSWAWQHGRKAHPTSDVFLLGRSAAVAVRTHTGDGVLAHLAVLRLGARAQHRVTAGPRMPIRSVWQGIAGADFFALVPHPTRPETALVRAPIRGGQARVILRARRLARPIQIDERIVTAGHDGAQVILGAFGGIDRPDRRAVLRSPLPPRQVLAAGTGALAILRGDMTAPFIFFGAQRGRIEAVGSLVQPRAHVSGVIRAGDRLYVAEGTGVQGYHRRSLREAGKKLRAELLDDKLETAFLTFSAMSLLIHRESAVPDHLRSLLAQRVLVLRHAADAGKRLLALKTLLHDLDQRLNRDALQFRFRWRPFASFLADKMLASKRKPSPSELVILLGIKRRLLNLLGLHKLEGTAKAFLPQLRSLLIVYAAVLAKIGLPGQGADLVAAWLKKTSDDLPGLENLHRALALAGLERIVRRVRAQLVSDDDAIRHAAGRTLAKYAHSRVALVDPDLVRRESARILSRDPNVSRAAASALVRTLKRALKQAKRQVGRPLSRPGCRAVCQAISDTCLNRCREPKACEKAGKRCLRSCRRGRYPRWRPPGGIPAADEETQICD